MLAAHGFLAKSASALVLNVFSGGDKPPKEESSSGLQEALKTSDDFELVINQPNQSVNNLYPDTSGFEFWKHIGRVGMGSGIYLGNGYVLTSAHVGCYPFQMFDGSFYRPDHQSWEILKQENGTESDLAIFRVTISGESSELGRLGAIPIANQSPRLEDAVLMMGTGLQQNSTPAAMSSNGRVLAVLGYHIERNRSTRGGLNHVEAILETPVKTGPRETHCFTTKFDHRLFEAQASDGDSGGATFVYNRDLGQWELAGCIIAVSQKSGFVPFGSLTFLADLSRYQSQIAKILPGPPVEIGGPVTELAQASMPEPAAVAVAPGSIPDPQMVKIPAVEVDVVADDDSVVPM